MDSHSKFGLASSLSIAYLQDMVNQVHLPSSNASNSTLSTISGTSPTWLLDSACCNHMTSSPDVVPSHTSTSLPTIYTVRASPTHTNFYTISSKWCKIQLQPTPFLTPFHQNLVQMNSATPNLVFHYSCTILFFLVLLFNF